MATRTPWVMWPRSSRRLSREFGFSIIMSDHMKKLGDKSRIPAGESIRGSSDKVAATDYILTMDESEEEIIVRQVKARNARRMPGFKVKIEDGDEDEAMLVYAGDAAETMAAESAEAVLAMLRIFMPADKEMSRIELVALAKSGKITVKRLDAGLNFLIKAGVIARFLARTPGKKGAPSYVYRWANEARDIDRDDLSEGGHE